MAQGARAGALCVPHSRRAGRSRPRRTTARTAARAGDRGAACRGGLHPPGDRKSTRLNSSHLVISYAVFCLKKKTTMTDHPELVNSSPYGEGWMVKLRLSDPSHLDTLMAAQAYEQSIVHVH